MQYIKALSNLKCIRFKIFPTFKKNYKALPTESPSVTKRVRPCDDRNCLALVVKINVSSNFGTPRSKQVHTKLVSLMSSIIRINV